MNSIVVAMVVGIIIIGIILLFIMSATRKKAAGIDVATYRSKWLKIEGNSLEDEANQHVTILSADKLLDAALKDRGFVGETMGERMKAARNSFSSNDSIWAAHKLRNKIAHESEVKMKPKTVRYALKAYKTALKDLGAL